jgi:hypothetical protein
VNETEQECPVCRVRMEKGHVLEYGNSDRLKRVTWTEGEPEKGALTGYRTKGRRQYATVTLRCPRCGWLLWFAPEAPA